MSAGLCVCVVAYRGGVSKGGGVQYEVNQHSVHTAFHYSC